MSRLRRPASSARSGRWSREPKVLSASFPRRRSLARRSQKMGWHRAHGARKEADVVILILGGNPGRPGARRWAAETPNLLNVAVSRARRRLYVIANREAWGHLRYFDVLADSLPTEPSASASARLAISRAVFMSALDTARAAPYRRAKWARWPSTACIAVGPFRVPAESPICGSAMSTASGEVSFNSLRRTYVLIKESGLLRKHLKHPLVNSVLSKQPVDIDRTNLAQPVTPGTRSAPASRPAAPHRASRPSTQPTTSSPRAWPRDDSRTGGHAVASV